ncbi:MAG: ATP-binding cassette domain-containing protein [Schwartzia sp.]|nr:ATP-binding cassette domain-containing protein [Schwartzia sp. (in: firmicutes)]
MLLEVSNLDISYGEHPIVHDVSLKLDSGKVIAIVGESGSGKTTVIRAILGCLPNEGHVTNGKIVFDGKNLLENTAEEWRKVSGKDITMVFQASGVGLSENELSSIPRIVAVAAGSGKARAIISVMRHHHHELLVTDEGAARAIQTVLRAEEAASHRS